MTEVKERVGLTDGIIEANEGRFGLDVRVDGDADEAEIEVGDTGVVLNVYLDGAWVLTFEPPSGFSARTKEDMVINPLLFVAGMEALVGWFNGIDLEEWKNPEGLIRNDTNPRMHRFRQQLFGELGDVTGVRGIYEEKGETDNGNFDYELRLSALAAALHRLDRLPEEQKEGVRFYRLRERGRGLFRPVAEE
jgi:hypothetical protein